LTYFVNEKEHRYYPDFQIGNTLVEIKGSHLIDKNTGMLIYPYKYSDHLKQVLVAKSECMRANNVFILTTEEMKDVIDYVKYRYGRGYLKSFKNR